MNNLSNKELNIRLIKAFPLLMLNQCQLPFTDYVMVSDLTSSRKFDFNSWGDIMPIAELLKIYARPIAGGYYAQDQDLTATARHVDHKRSIVICCIKKLESGAAVNV